MAAAVRNAGSSELTLGDNRKVDLSQTVIFLPLEPRGSQIADLITGVWVSSSRRQGTTGVQAKSAEDRGGSGERKFSPVVHESPGQSRGVFIHEGEELDECWISNSCKYRSGCWTSTTRPFCFDHKRRPGVSGRGNRPKYGRRP